MKPHVVKINKKHDNFTLYIGRDWAGLKQSKWHNPFHLYNYANDRAMVLRLYEEHIRKSAELIATIPELEDQVLGCWCYPDTCHGDVLVKIYKEVMRPGVGDMAMPAHENGDFMLPAPLLIEYVSKPFDKEWVKLETQLGLIPREQVVWPC